MGVFRMKGGVGAKKFGMSLETKGRQSFWWAETPEKLAKQALAPIIISLGVVLPHLPVGNGALYNYLVIGHSLRV